jgi:membrane complex biogenesis BtpA family protein
MDKMSALFGITKPVIGMLHLGALPGRPRHDVSAGLDAIVDAVGEDLRALQNAGFDGVMFCNENDIPYQLHAGPEVPAAMAAVIGQLKRDIRVPFGVDVLWDATAALALARATGARWVREILTGVYESDQGMIEPRIGDIAGYRHQIGADDVLLFDNIQPEFASAVGHRTIADRARGAAFLGLDAILVSGFAAGTPMELADLRIAKEAAGDLPVFANTGVRAEALGEILEVADGAIVGTSIKVDGVTWNPVDPGRARRLMDAASAAREREATGAVPGAK